MINDLQSHSFEPITILAAEPPVGSLSKNYESVDADRQHSSPSVTVSLSANWCLSNQISENANTDRRLFLSETSTGGSANFPARFEGKEKQGRRESGERACVDVSIR